MSSNYYFHGINALGKAEQFAEEHKDFSPEIYQFNVGRSGYVVVLTR